MEVMHDRMVEGIKLALQTPQYESNKTNFFKFIKLFSECQTFLASMAPFSNRCFGPSWFRVIFHGGTPTTRAHLNAIWPAFITPTLLSCRIESIKKIYRFTGYHPNLVPWHFGLSQMLLKSLYAHETDIWWSGRPFSSRNHVNCLKFHNTQFLELPTFAFQTSYLTTNVFEEWWNAYYKLFDASSFTEKLKTAYEKFEDRLNMSKFFAYFDYYFYKHIHINWVLDLSGNDPVDKVEGPTTRQILLS